jgi:SHS2 domain-containing protein
VRRKTGKRPRFRTIDHTADVGLVVWGDNRAALFENAAAGLFHLLYPVRSGGHGGKRFDFELAETNLEELLVDWLRQLLYVHEAEGLHLSDFRVDLRDGPRLTASCRGREIEPSRQHYDIKLVTYHGLMIERVDERFRVRVIFDI